VSGGNRQQATGNSAPPLPHSPDYGLIVITLALLCMGIVMVYSASLVASYAEHGDQTYFFQRQLLWSGLGVVVMFLFIRIPYRWWRHVSLLAMVISVALLIAVLVPGWAPPPWGRRAGSGSRAYRWASPRSCAK